MTIEAVEQGATRDNRESRRYERTVDGQTAYAQYDLTDGVIAFISTQTPPPLRGKGVASALIGDALRDARARGLKVRAECSFVADYLARHSEFSDLAR